MKNYRAMLFVISFLIAMQAQAADQIEKIGNALQFILPASAASISLLKADKEGLTDFGMSVVTTVGVTEVLKYTVNETRPNGGKHSFPSGHSSISFASAEYLRKRYGWEYGIPAYTLASFVGYSRVESKNHYVHDVIAGAAIGIASSYFYTEPYPGWRVQMEADAQSQYIGLKINGTW